MLTIITLYTRDKQNSNIKDQEDAVENSKSLRNSDVGKHV